MEFLDIQTFSFRLKNKKANMLTYTLGVHTDYCVHALTETCKPPGWGEGDTLFHKVLANYTKGKSQGWWHLLISLSTGEVETHCGLTGRPASTTQ